MPAKRAHGNQEFYPWSAIVTRPGLRCPDNARVALAVIANLGALGLGRCRKTPAGAPACISGLPLPDERRGGED